NRILGINHGVRLKIISDELFCIYLYKYEAICKLDLSLFRLR
ncbi:unnamed protein product, partial [Leptidea sinapis]